jgi:hypothetical protein
MICLRCGHYTHPDREMDCEQRSENCACRCHPWNNLAPSVTSAAWRMYPAGWPACRCGAPVLDGHLTCGRVECGTQLEASQ